MNLIELTEFLVKSVVKDSDSVSVKEFKTDEETIIEVLASENEIGAIIGKKGHTINAIRTIVQASAYANNLKYVKMSKRYLLHQCVKHTTKRAFLAL